MSPMGTSAPIGRPRGAGDQHNSDGTRPTEIVEQVVAVPAGPAAADLYKPRPHGTGRGADGYRTGGSEMGMWLETVAGKGTGKFGRCGPPAKVPFSIERRRRKRRPIVGEGANVSNQLGRCWASSDGRFSRSAATTPASHPGPSLREEADRRR